ncbi:MAG TPA: hypothetical protein ENF65_02670 [Euryarchaeota archaeon]|nr:hypothetical protein [Euryarchaeota archaeon]
MAFRREIAFKLYLKEISNGKYDKEERVLTLSNGLKVRRVHVIGTVVSKYEGKEKNYLALTIDDGSDTIRLKVWGEDIPKLASIEIGDTVDVIGRIREYGGELYISPEIVRKIEDPNFEILRELEMIKSYVSRRGKTEELEVEMVPEEIDKREQLLRLIEEKDYGEGVSMDTLFEELGLDEEELSDLIIELLNEGEIYEPKPGVYRRVL